MTTSYGPDPVDSEIAELLDQLAHGHVAGERLRVDFKEEAGRRDRQGRLGPSLPQNEQAARALAQEAACMANTEGGGALIVGVADDGHVIGTALDSEWLRSRIYDLTQRLLTVEVREVLVHGSRLLVVRSLQAIEPIRWNQRITWRVADRCVEVDATTWHATRMARSRFDWSGLESHVDASQVRPPAIERAREFLRDSGEPAALDLAHASQADLLRRLNVVTADGYLTNAGVIAFVGREDPGIEYVRREHAGGDSTVRIRTGARSLIEEVAAVEQAISTFNGVRHVQRGFVVGQVRDLPPLAVREAIVNGVVHRDWASAAPTLVEHTRRSIVVTSPGGFIGGVTPQNIITHPSQPRHRALAELFASLRLAEREGIGVDRMVREMISLGHPAPDIREVPGPFVRTALIGERLDEAWIGFLTRLAPSEARFDLDTLLLLSRLATHGWVDAVRAAPLLQRSEIEATAALRNLETIQIDGAALTEPVAGVPASQPGAWRLSSTAERVLDAEHVQAGSPRPPRPRPEVALEWARARGRVSTTELGSLVGAAPSNVGAVLKGLERQGELEPSRSNRSGPGFYYKPVAEPSAT